MLTQVLHIVYNCILLTYCWQSAGLLRKFCNHSADTQVCWYSADKLMTFWWHSSKVLLTQSWHSSDILMTFSWHSAVILLIFCWHSADILLIFCWYSAANLLTFCCPSGPCTVCQMLLWPDSTSSLLTSSCPATAPAGGPPRWWPVAKTKTPKLWVGGSLLVARAESLRGECFPEISEFFFSRNWLGASRI